MNEDMLSRIGKAMMLAAVLYWIIGGMIIYAHADSALRAPLGSLQEQM